MKVWFTSNKIHYIWSTVTMLGLVILEPVVEAAEDPEEASDQEKDSDDEEMEEPSKIFYW